MPAWSQTIARIWRHRWSEGQIQGAFPPAALQSIEAAVEASEGQHTGQIRICIEGGLPLSYLWRAAPARERALRLFGKLGVWDTEHNNGVLIYVLMADHAIEIVADRALARAVPQSTWDALVQDMHRAFHERAFAHGVEQALQQVSAVLAQHFPRSHKHAEDASSAQPNAPVVQRRFLKD